MCTPFNDSTEHNLEISTKSITKIGRLQTVKKHCWVCSSKLFKIYKKGPVARYVVKIIYVHFEIIIENDYVARKLNYLDVVTGCKISTSVFLYYEKD